MDYERKEPVMTGFQDLDRIIQGFKPGTLNCVASRPAMGKSSLIQNMFLNNISDGKNALFIDLCCGDIYQTIENFNAILAFKKQPDFFSLKKQKNSFSQIETCVDFCFKAILQTIDQYHKTMPSLDIVYIDYFQLINFGDGNKYELLSSSLSMLLQKAKELQIPIVFLSQLSRKPDERINHRPMLSDISETASIENICSMILFVMRRDYYDPLDKPGVIEVIIGKNRYGKIGHIQLMHFLPVLLNFVFTQEDEEESSLMNFKSFKPK